MITSVYGKPLADWASLFPLLPALLAGEPVSWFNPQIATLAEMDIYLRGGSKKVSAPGAPDTSHAREPNVG